MKSTFSARSFARTSALPALVVVLALAAIGVITLLQERSNSSDEAQLKLATLSVELNRLQGAPFSAHASTGGSPARAAALMRTAKQKIARTLDELRRHSPPAGLNRLAAPLRADYLALDRIYVLGATGVGYLEEADRLARGAGRSTAAVSVQLAAATREYERRASRAQARATVGTVAAVLLLLMAFGLVYRRSIRARSTAERLVQENRRLLAVSREEATRDSLTGLRNRRALINDLTRDLKRASSDEPLVLVLFDLDGFKQYNDTFGHPAGDALLTHLGEQAETALAGRATLYRMGGDEFCTLAPAGARNADELARVAAAALSESGDVFHVGCSYGITNLPTEAVSVAEALRIADQRMYEHKAGRSSASRQSTDVLLKVLSERSTDLQEHITGVAHLAELTAERLGLEHHEVKRIRLAAELHDVGKTAIPDTILNKPDKLDAEEWEFMKRHTLIGERIIRAAPALAHTADLVRSSHECFDGGGYPDGLKGSEIPLGSSIISVCDAFDAMISERPYRDAMTTEGALVELRRCSGTQFLPEVVESFCELAAELEPVA